MVRRLGFSLIAFALVVAGCSRGLDGPLKYAIELDASSTTKDKIQLSAFYPGDIRLSPGDSIKFRNRSTEAPHTVTFGVLPDRSNQPPILVPGGENPAVLGKCYTRDEASTKLTTCKNKRLPSFNGRGYWNSGFLQPKPAPKSAGGKSITLKLARDIPAGNYTFVCVLHPFMNGAMTVVEEEGDRSKPADVRKATKDDAKEAMDKAKALDAPEVERTDDGVTVAAGWGDKLVSVNRFAAEEIEIETGDTVTWEFPSPQEPHSVTFGGEFEPGDPESVPPAGVGSGGAYSGGLANSGWIFPEGEPFSLQFTAAGTYDYVCVLHPGMEGTVKVG